MLKLKYYYSRWSNLTPFFFTVLNEFLMRICANYKARWSFLVFVFCALRFVLLVNRKWMVRFLNGSVHGQERNRKTVKNLTSGKVRAHNHKIRNGRGNGHSAKNSFRTISEKRTVRYGHKVYSEYTFWGIR